MKNISKLYQNRFPAEQRASKDRIWKTLCRGYFQRYVAKEASILDLGSGYCEFINNIQAAKKFAVDLNPAARSFAGPRIKFVRASGKDLRMFKSGSLDNVFTSNFFEHIPSKDEIDLILKEIFRVLKPGGLFLVLQPNIKYLAGAYWDFYDHHTPLTHLSMTEALSLQGFRVQTCVPRFLPYTTKSSLPQHPFWVWLYLKLPMAWRFFGKQMFLVALKPVKPDQSKPKREIP